MRNKIPLDWWKEFVGELFEDSGCQDPPVIECLLLQRMKWRQKSGKIEEANIWGG